MSTSIMVAFQVLYPQFKIEGALTYSGPSGTIDKHETQSLGFKASSFIDAPRSAHVRNIKVQRSRSGPGFRKY